MVDLEKGNFNSNVELEGADFAASETASNVITEDEIAGVDSGNWVGAYLDPSYNIYVNTTD